MRALAYLYIYIYTCVCVCVCFCACKCEFVYSPGKFRRVARLTIRRAGREDLNEGDCALFFGEGGWERIAAFFVCK